LYSMVSGTIIGCDSALMRNTSHPGLTKPAGVSIRRWLADPTRSLAAMDSRFWTAWARDFI
jgi:hypothetical protein